MTEWKTVSDGCGDGEKEKKGEEKGPGRVFMLFEGHCVRGVGVTCPSERKALIQNIKAGATWDEITSSSLTV